jgi:hypothetical protein
MWSLQAQDVDVDESMIHLADVGEDGPAEPFVELKSTDDQQALLELGSLHIKKTPVRRWGEREREATVGKFVRLTLAACVARSIL